jgi:predicted HTH domain antitoxin
MSGTKLGTIRMMQRAALQQDCARTAQWLKSQEPVCTVAEIEKALAEARAEARGLRQAGQSGKQDARFQTMMDNADSHREDLTLLLKEKRQLWDQADRAVSELKNELARCGRNLEITQINEAHIALGEARRRAELAQKSLNTTSREIALHLREIKLWSGKLNQVTNQAAQGQLPKGAKRPVIPEKSADEVKQEIQAEALLAEVG